MLSAATDLALGYRNLGLRGIGAPRGENNNIFQCGNNASLAILRNFKDFFVLNNRSEITKPE